MHKEITSSPERSELSTDTGRSADLSRNLMSNNDAFKAATAFRNPSQAQESLPQVSIDFGPHSIVKGDDPWSRNHPSNAEKMPTGDGNIAKPTRRLPDIQVPKRTEEQYSDKAESVNEIRKSMLPRRAPEPLQTIDNKQDIYTQKPHERPFGDAKASGQGR